MSVSQEKKWNPATQKFDYIVRNEYTPTKQESVLNRTSVGQDNWINPTDGDRFTNLFGKNISLYTVTGIAEDGAWVEFSKNSDGSKLVVSAEEHFSWSRSMWA